MDDALRCRCPLRVKIDFLHPLIYQQVRLKTFTRQSLFSIFVLTMLLASKLFAQKNNIRFEHLSVEQGLSHGTVNCILQDSKGFMWFGTADGLNRFDGYGFIVYKHDLRNPNSLSNNWVWSIAEDQYGAIWIGTSSGLNKFDPATETFMLYKHEADNPQSLSHDEVTSIYEDRSGTLWVGTRGGLNRFDRATQTFTRFRHDPRNPNSLSNDFIGPIYEDEAGALWIGTGFIVGGGGLNKFNRETETFKHYRPDPVHPNSLSNWITSIYEDQSHTLWIGSDCELVKFDRDNETFLRYPNLNYGSNCSIKSLCADRAGVLWIGSWDRGLHKLDRATGAFTNYIEDMLNPTSLSNNNIMSIYKDKLGMLWIGTWGGGVNKFDPTPELFSHYKQYVHDPKAFKVNDMQSIYEDESGTLWVGTKWGLSKFDRATESFTWYRNSKNPSSLSNNNVFSICEDKSGILWIGTGNGLNKMDKITGRFTHHYPQRSTGFTGFMIFSIYEDQAGILWLGTSQGLDKFDPLSMTHTIYQHDPRDPTSLSHNYVRSIFEDRSDILWLGTIDGLNKFDRVMKTFTRFKYDPQNLQSLSNSIVLTIHEDKSGTLWIGTAGGLNKFDRTAETFTYFTEKDGLSNDVINGILEDPAGNLWISTNKGLSKFNPQTGRFKNYDVSDGLQDNDFNECAYFKGKSGEMFFGGVNGFNAFYPERVKDNRHIPPIVITAFKKFEQPAELDSAIAMKKEVELSYKDNFFSFEFAALNYTNSGKNQYAYKLEGFDKYWIYCGTRRYASYTNINGGTYTFRVKGSNNDGIWNELGTSIRVVIIPPFWKAWWFQSLFWTTIVVSIGGTIRYIEIRKLRQRLTELEEQKALEKERLRISQDMHDEVGASLTEIAILSELAKKDMKKPQEAQTHIQKISERAREVIDNIGEIIWAINPKNDRLDDLAAYLRHYAVQYFQMTPIECRCEFPYPMPDIRLSAESRRSIFLVVKEALHNIVKHATATAVVLSFTGTPTQLEILIHDNGKGFSPENLSHFGNGLYNMKKRLEDIGATFNIQSQPNCGTNIRLVVGFEL